MNHRANVNFSQEAWDAINDLANRQGKTKSAVIRDAIGLAKWFADVQAEGARVLVERDGAVREVICR